MCPSLHIHLPCFNYPGFSLASFKMENGYLFKIVFSLFMFSCIFGKPLKLHLLNELSSAKTLALKYKNNHILSNL